MKYRVAKENPTNLQPGTELEYDPTIEGIKFRGMGNKWFIGRDAIEYCDWFEAVPKVEVGQYWKTPRGAIFRIGVNISRNNYYADWAAQPVAHTGAVSGRFTTEYLVDECELLSDDQVEQALIEEAKRRGYKKGDTIYNPFYDSENELTENRCGEMAYSYNPKTDGLCYGFYTVYKLGQWAEIVEEWEVKPIPNTRFFSIIKNEDYKITSVGKCGLDKKQAEAIKEALNDLV